MEIKKFENNLIAFDFDSEMVNATDMLRKYPDKRMNDFLRLKSTKEYIAYLESKTGNPVTVIKQGGAEQGTWMCRKLAFEFAGWLNLEFKDFIYDVFDGYLKDRLNYQQRQLDYFWDKSDQKDLYNR
jgi:hypothetical protein